MAAHVSYVHKPAELECEVIALSAGGHRHESETDHEVNQTQ
jgi:hypothetical protein